MFPLETKPRGRVTWWWVDLSPGEWESHEQKMCRLDRSACPGRNISSGARVGVPRSEGRNGQAAECVPV